MGACFSIDKHSNTPEYRLSRAFDQEIKIEEKQKATEIKLLLLGAGESGKSTILKSMRIIHHVSFTSTEREHYRRLVFLNLVQGMKMLLDAMEEWDVDFSDSYNANFLPLFVSVPDISDDEGFPIVYLSALQHLWADSGVQTVFKRGNEVAIPENLMYYYADLPRLFDKHYTPTHADILRCRNKTTGIIETTFALDDHIYRIFDVGGQRSERKKWIHCFENVTAVLFLVALSGYDSCLVEDKDSNQMQEALMLFDSICNSKWFVRTSMILFLNKVDLFRARILQSSVRRYYPDYEGHDHDYNTARACFKSRFVRLNRSTTKQIYPSYTQATDTTLLKSVMASATDIILTNNLRAIIL